VDENDCFSEALLLCNNTAAPFTTDRAIYDHGLQFPIGSVNSMLMGNPSLWMRAAKDVGRHHGHISVSHEYLMSSLRWHISTWIFHWQF
jgi:hypothetical protein